MVPAASGLVLLLLLAAIGAGLRIPGLSYLSGLPGFGPLDYRTLTTGGFLPLRADYVDQVLGTDHAVDPRPTKADTTTTSTPATPTLLPPLTPPRPATEPPRNDPDTAVPDHPFTNDAMSTPVTIAALPYTGRTDDSQATREPGEPDGCSRSGGTAWYRYTTRRDATLFADTIGTDHATAIAVFVTDPDTGLQQIGCATGATGNAQLGFTARQGQTLLFQLTGVVTGGRLVFHLNALGRTSLASGPTPVRRPTDGAAVPAISGNGRYVAYESRTLPLCREDTCPAQLVLTDRRTGSTTLVSGSPSGQPGNGASVEPSLSDDGRYVGFSSDATNLVAGDTNRAWDYFVHDRTTGRTARVTVSSEGRQGTRWECCAVRGTSGSLSPDGRYAVFSTTLGDLVANDPPGVRARAVFVHDLRTGRTTMESVDEHGNPGLQPSTNGRLSRDGRYLAFLSGAQNLAPARYASCPDSQYSCPNVFVRDRRLGTTHIVSVAPDGTADMSAQYLDLSADGDIVAWSTSSALGDPSDTNEAPDVFVVDLHKQGSLKRISVLFMGAQPERAAGPEQYVFSDFYGARVDVSGDGSRVAFASSAMNLVAEDTNGANDIFLRDLTTLTTTRVSTSSEGVAGNGDSYVPTLSYDGRVVAFDSEADNLVAGDANHVGDVFVHDLTA